MGFQDVRRIRRLVRGSESYIVLFSGLCRKVSFNVYNGEFEAEGLNDLGEFHSGHKDVSSVDVR